MQNLRRSKAAKSISNYYLLLAMFGTVATLVLFSNHAHAADLLANTLTSDVKDTINGTGKKWAVLIDLGISIGAFIMTKKPLVFFSVFGVLLAISAAGSFVN